MAEPDENADALVPLGVVIKPHGIKGDLRIHAFHPDSALWRRSKKAPPLEVTFSKDGESRVHAVTKISRAAKFLIFVVDGIDGRDPAEAMRGWEIAVPRSVLPPPDEDEFYLRDLVGLVVLRDDEEVGHVEDVMDYPAAMCAKVVSEDGVREVPLMEPWTLAIDLEEGVLVVGDWDDLPVQA